jgi:hypothetical protein
MEKNLKGKIKKLQTHLAQISTETGIRSTEREVTCTRNLCETRTEEGVYSLPSSKKNEER